MGYTRFLKVEKEEEFLIPPNEFSCILIVLGQQVYGTSCVFCFIRIRKDHPSLYVKNYNN